MASRAWRAMCLPRPSLRPPTAATSNRLAAIDARRPRRACAARLIARDHLHIAVVGAIDASARRALVDEVFADLPATSRAVDHVRRRRSPGWARDEIVDLDVPQSTIRFGRPALQRDDPDFIASLVLAHVLGGGTALLAPLPRSARKARPRLFRLRAVATFDHASYLYGGTTTKNERARGIARSDPATRSSIWRDGGSAKRNSTRARNI